MNSAWIGRLSGAARLSRLSQVDLHVDQPRRLPRIPDSKLLRDGDIVNIDVTYILDGCTAIRAACI